MAPALFVCLASLLSVVTRRYVVRTFGCQMNEHDSERIAGLLEQDGLEPIDDEAKADDDDEAQNCSPFRPSSPGADVA